MNYHNDYNRDTFWTSFDEENNRVRYYIKLNGVMIEVEKDVYHIMFNSYRKGLRFNKQYKNTLISLDSDMYGQGLYNVLSADLNIEAEVYNRIIADSMQKAVAELDEIDKRIIVGLFYENKTETAIAGTLGISKQAVQKRKRRIFERLKNVADELLNDFQK